MSFETAEWPPNQALDLERIALLSPEEQETYLLEAAVQACDSLECRAYAAELQPFGDPLGAQVYREALRLHPEDPTRPRILGSIAARHPEAQEAWGEALLSAVAIGRSQENRPGHLEIYPLEDLAFLQTDPVRLEQIIQEALVYRSYARSRVLAAVAEQQARNGDVDSALATWGRIPLHWSSERDKAALAIVEAYARNGDSWEAYMANTRVSIPRKIWGVIKIGIHTDRGIKDQETLRAKLDDHKQEWPTDELLRIAPDVAAAGHPELAVDLALGAVRGGAAYLTRARSRQTNTILGIADRLAETDPAAARYVLERLRTDAEAQFNIALEKGMHIPEGDIPGTIFASAYRSTLMARLTRGSIHSIAIDALQDPDVALKNLGLLTPYTGDAEMAGLYLDEARAVVGRSLAKAGHTLDAIRLISSMSAHPFIVEEKSRAFTDLARILRRRRLAKANGQLAANACSA